jgi:A/G-specific adenine glycosylase
MLALPTGEWTAAPVKAAQALGAAPARADWRSAGVIDHVFTHFALTLEVWRAESTTRDPGLLWLPIDAAARALPSVFLKAVRLAQEPTLI